MPCIVKFIPSGANTTHREVIFINLSYTFSCVGLLHTPGLVDIIINQTAAAAPVYKVSVRAWSRRPQPGTLALLRLRSPGLQVVQCSVSSAESPSLFCLNFSPKL